MGYIFSKNRSFLDRLENTTSPQAPLETDSEENCNIGNKMRGGTCDDVSHFFITDMNDVFGLELTKQRFTLQQKKMLNKMMTFISIVIEDIETVSINLLWRLGRDCICGNYIFCLLNRDSNGR